MTENLVVHVLEWTWMLKNCLSLISNCLILFAFCFFVKIILLDLHLRITQYSLFSFNWIFHLSTIVLLVYYSVCFCVFVDTILWQKSSMLQPFRTSSKSKTFQVFYFMMTFIYCISFHLSIIQFFFHYDIHVEISRNFYWQFFGSEFYMEHSFQI